MPPWSNIEDILEVANDSKIVHVCERLASLLADLFHVCVVVLFQRRLRRQRLFSTKRRQEERNVSFGTLLCGVYGCTVYSVNQNWVEDEDLRGTSARRPCRLLRRQ